MNKFGPQVFALAAAASIAFPALGQTMRPQPVDPLRAVYVATAAARDTGIAEAKAVEIDHVRWDRVIFRNDGGRRVVHVQLWTKAASYAELKARLTDPRDSLWDLLDDAGVQTAAAHGSDLMICNHGASGVVLSFDRSMAAPSPVQMAATQPDFRDVETDAAG